MTLVKFKERKDSGLMSSVSNDIFENFLNDSFVADRMTSRVPAVNISETEGYYHIELAAPGLKKEDFKISLAQNIMTISAETKTEPAEEDKNTISGNTATRPLCGHSPYPIPLTTRISRRNIMMAY